MRKTSCIWLHMAILSMIPAVSGAAGTYYNTGYTTTSYETTESDYYGNSSAKSRSSAKRYNNNSYANRYGTTKKTTRKVVKKTSSTKTEAQKPSEEPRKQGFYFGAGLTHEMSNWDFEMKSAGSKLSYDNLNWNVIDGHATYYFGDSTPMQIKVGARYGLQYGDSSMIDDDMTMGGYLEMAWTDESDNVVAYQTGHALSVGSSKDGKQMGFNVSFGLTDMFSWGKLKITPSVGYRYFKYEVSTKQNYGVAIDVLQSTDLHPYETCITGYMGELQCDPYLLFYSTSGAITITGRVKDSEGNVSDIIQMPNIPGFDVAGVSTGGTYYYEQSGTSHKYEVEWAGPYVALDMSYDIDKDNSLYGGLELGLPKYRSVGDQPYRYDWEHPKSVEDEGGFGDAYHIGLNAGWTTSIGESTSLTLGFTYDYYNVSKATAKTYLNSSYQQELYDAYVDALENNVLTDYQREVLQEQVEIIDGYRSSGWVLEDKDEIKSVYKSMGIRAGLTVKF